MLNYKVNNNNNDNNNINYNLNNNNTAIPLSSWRPLPVLPEFYRPPRPAALCCARPPTPACLRHSGHQNLAKVTPPYFVGGTTNVVNLSF